MNELWEYPFRSEVWGTVADWTMVSVTAATLWYLIKTLRSQLKVQEYQQKVTLIENEKYRLENQPFWESRLLGMITQRMEDDIHKVFTFESVLTGAYCKNVSFDFKSRNVILTGAESGSFSSELASIGNTYRTTFEAVMSIQAYTDKIAIIDIKISFMDGAGNKYSQDVEIVLGDSTEITQDEQPRLVSI